MSKKTRTGLFSKAVVQHEKQNCETRSQRESIISQHSFCLYCPLFAGHGQCGCLRLKKPQLPSRRSGCRVSITILGVGAVAVT